MKRIYTSYNQFIFENEFQESSNSFNKLQAFLEGKRKLVRQWFERGEFPNASLADDVEISSVSDFIKKTLTFSFSDGNFYYKVEFTVQLKDYEEGNFNKGFLTIKKYELVDDGDLSDDLKEPLMDVWDSNNPEVNPDENGQIDIKTEFTPDFIIDKISQMDNNQTALGTNNTEENTEGENEGEF